MLSETKKAHNRRISEGFFEKYIRGSVLDIGCSSDLSQMIVPYAIPYDLSLGSGDAQYLREIKDETFDTVYCSHLLEHISDEKEALKNWCRVLKPNGYLIICVPERDLYEKKKKLPSRWAEPSHQRFYKIGIHEPPDTHDIIRVINNSLDKKVEIVYSKVVNEGYNYSLPDDVVPVGEYSIEVVMRKKKNESKR